MSVVTVSNITDTAPLVIYAPQDTVVLKGSIQSSSTIHILAKTVIPENGTAIQANGETTILLSSYEGFVISNLTISAPQTTRVFEAADLTHGTDRYFSPPSLEGRVTIT